MHLSAWAAVVEYTGRGLNCRELMGRSPACLPPRSPSDASRGRRPGTGSQLCDLGFELRLVKHH